MKKTIFIILSLLTGILNLKADANWKIHTTFDEEVSHVIETPDYVYFTSRNMPENSVNDTYFALFRYDKKGDEIESLSINNILSSPLITDIAYNPAKNYIAILYSDQNIDLLHNNGNISRIPYYAMSSMTSSKKMNGISFDGEKDRIYIATEFGYISINDKKEEIAESRIYNTPLNSFSRIGDYYYIIHDNLLKRAPTGDSRFNTSDYETVRFKGTTTLDGYTLQAIYPLQENFFVLKYKEGNQSNLMIVKISGEEAEVYGKIAGPVVNTDYNSKGLFAAVPQKVYQIGWDGEATGVNIPSDYSYSSVNSVDMTNFRMVLPRKGLANLRLSGEQWNVTKNYMAPNAPAVFISTSYAQHPTKGFMMLNHGLNQVTQSLYRQISMQLSGYNRGIWTNYSPAYTNPKYRTMLLYPKGIVFEPQNPDIAYIASTYHGLIRMNLSDPEDVLVMSRGDDEWKDTGKFVDLVATPVLVPGYANFSHPYFDAKGNLWSSYSNWNMEETRPQLYCWTAEDRLATTSAANARPPKLVEINTPVSISNYNILLPLLKTGNGILVFTPSVFEEELMLLNTNGTPTDTSDDRLYRFTSFTDSDGNTIELRQIRCLYEDPNTGYVWVSHLNGVCYFIPSQIINNDNYQINRVKVPRNDGTNLADYLLEGITVNWITSDNQGRKWFATNGGGVVCTSSDGREIIMELTAENSMLPMNVVYSAAYNPENNSMIFSTEGGLAEYYLPVAQNSSEQTDVKAYPNPVRPEHNGYVTITDIPQGSLVKIVDAGGNLVKELGIMSGFEILWDISNTRFQRVESGVYYIMVSPSDENGSYHKVGKVLVIS